MSDETPREPVRETPAAEGHDGEQAGSASGPGAAGGLERPRLDLLIAPPGSTWRGVRALLLIVAGMIALELLLYAAARQLDGTRWEGSFNSSQALIWLAGLIGVIVAIVRLPPHSRTAFLASCGILVAGVFTLLIVTCGIMILTMR
jgi:hypothetical protein